MVTALAFVLALPIAVGHAQDRVATDRHRPGAESPREEFNRLQLQGLRDDADTYGRLDAIRAATTDPAFLLELDRFNADCLRRGGRTGAAADAYRRILANEAADDLERLNAVRSLAELAWIGGDLLEAESLYATLLSDLQAITAHGVTRSDRYGLLAWLPVAARHHHAAVLAGLGRTNEAVAEYESLVEANVSEPAAARERGFSNAVALVNAAGLLLAVGERERGAADLRRARELDPAYMPGCIEHRLLDASGVATPSPERAAALERILGQFPDDVWRVRVMLDLVYEQEALGRADDAAAALARLVALPRQESQLYGSLIVDAQIEAAAHSIDVAMRRKEYPRAERELAAMLRTFADDPKARDISKPVADILARLRSSGVYAAEAGEIGPTDDVRTSAAGSSESGPALWRVLLTVNGALVALGAAFMTLRRARPQRAREHGPVHDGEGNR